MDQLFVFSLMAPNHLPSPCKSPSQISCVGIDAGVELVPPLQWFLPERLADTTHMSPAAVILATSNLELSKSKRP